jgi:transposase
MVDVPWSRSGSGFTLLFEAFAMRLIESEMPINKVAKLLKVHANSIWTIFNYWLKKSYTEDNIENITQLGIDETSSKKGHKYITVAVDLEARRVIHATEGKNAKTIGRIKDYLVSKSVEPAKIAHASIDLSPSFISGLKNNFPNAEIHFDRFHVKKLLNEAMDEVRKLERKEHAELKGHKYTFLKNKNKLSDKKNQELSELITLFPTLGSAYRLKELFDDVWQMGSEEEASSFIDDWVKEVEKSNIPAFMKFSRTVVKNKYGIINFVTNKINNGILESINSKIQLAKKRARGYRNIDNFINMVYFLCGKLNFNFPLNSA